MRSRCNLKLDQREVQEKRRRIREKKRRIREKRSERKHRFARAALRRENKRKESGRMWMRRFPRSAPFPKAAAALPEMVRREEVEAWRGGERMRKSGGESEREREGWGGGERVGPFRHPPATCHRALQSQSGPLERYERINGPDRLAGGYQATNPYIFFPSLV
jgi:hypothetical protein